MRYSKAPDYFERAAEAISEMYSQTGPWKVDDNGMLLSGVVIRHLILPGCTKDSMQVLNFIAEQLPGGTPVSLMRQYTPQPFCLIKGLDRPVTDQEYRRVVDHFQQLQLTGYTQEKASSDTAYTPLFDFTGV